MILCGPEDKPEQPLNVNKNEKTNLLIESLSKSLETYFSDCGNYPTEKEGLVSLVKDPGEGICKNWGPVPYAKCNRTKTNVFGYNNCMVDAWGEPLSYASDGKSFKLISKSAEIMSKKSER